MTDENGTGIDTVDPPIGGADLECLLTCNSITITALTKILMICEEYGLRLVEQDSLFAYSADPIEPILNSAASGLNEFVTEATSKKARRCIANLEGRLSDTQTTLSILLDLDKSVAVVSIPEDFLWGFDMAPDHIDFEKLRAFAGCCEEIASELSAMYGYLGTEVLHTEDMTTGNAESSGACPVDSLFFSEARLRELFDWYRNTYVKRWK